MDTERLSGARDSLASDFFFLAGTVPLVFLFLVSGRVGASGRGAGGDRDELLTRMVLPLLAAVVERSLRVRESLLSRPLCPDSSSASLRVTISGSAGWSGSWWWVAA